MTIRHKFDSPISDEGLPPGAVKPSDWNDEHDIDGVLGALATLDATGDVVPYLDSAMIGQLASLTATGRAILACALVSDVLNYLGAATVNSPTLTGLPMAPTASVGTYSNQIATMAAIQNAINALIGGAPGALDTLNELAAAINDDASYATTVTNALASRLRVDVAQGLSSPAMVLGRANLGLGAAAILAVGTVAGDLVQLDGSAKLPVVDGSQLTNIVAAWANVTGKPTLGTAAALNVGTSANNLVQLDGSAKLPALDGSQLTNVGFSSAGMVNKFRNGTMDVWQRGTAVATITTAGGYGPDGWILVPTGASISSQAAQGLGLTVNSLFLSGNSGVTGLVCKQRIESYFAAALAGRAVTVQAKVFNNTGASITPKWTVKYPTVIDNYAATTTDTLASALSSQACANGVITTIAITFVPSGSPSLGMEVSLDLGNNFSTSGKTVQLGELDIRSTPGVAVGVNNSPPVPDLRPIGIELHLCQRYVQTSYSNGVTPGSNTSSTGDRAAMVGGSPYITSSVSVFVSRFQAPLRAAPATPLVWDQLGNAGKNSYWNNGTGWHDNDAAFVLMAAGANGFMWNIADSGANSIYLIHFFVSAEL